MSKMKRAIEKFQIDIKMKRLALHFKRELENVRKKSPVDVKSLDSSPVSYTHLDVYKRQVRIAAGGVSGAGRYQLLPVCHLCEAVAHSVVSHGGWQPLQG